MILLRTVPEYDYPTTMPLRFHISSVIPYPNTLAYTHSDIAGGGTHMHLIWFAIRQWTQNIIRRRVHLRLLLAICLCCHSSVAKPLIPSPYNGVDLRTMFTIVKRQCQGCLPPAFLLYQLWLCSSEDEIGAWCTHTQTGRIAVHLCVLVPDVNCTRVHMNCTPDHLFKCPSTVHTNQTNWTLGSSVLGPEP